MATSETWAPDLIITFRCEDYNWMASTSPALDTDDIGDFNWRLATFAVRHLHRKDAVKPAELKLMFFLDGNRITKINRENDNIEFPSDTAWNELLEEARKLLKLLVRINSLVAEANDYSPENVNDLIRALQDRQLIPADKLGPIILAVTCYPSYFRQAGFAPLESHLFALTLPIIWAKVRAQVREECMRLIQATTPGTREEINLRCLIGRIHSLFDDNEILAAFDRKFADKPKTI